MSKEGTEHFNKRIKGKCQAPEGCNVKKGLTIDHFTPKCVAKILGWSRKQLNDPMNRQKLCWEHHLMKDSVTPQIKEQVEFQLQGGFIDFGQHVVRR